MGEVPHGRRHGVNGVLFLGTLALLLLGGGWMAYRRHRHAVLVDRQGRMLAERLFGPPSDR